MTSREKLDEMNKEFDELKHVASEFENEYNEIDKEKLNKNEKKKLEDCLLTTSRIVETNKLFMKTSRTVFSDVHVENIVQSDNENYTQTCVHCTKSFRSTFQLDNHKCRNKYICEKCGIDTRNSSNLMLHKRKGCRSRICNKCRQQFYKIEKYKEHKESCNRVICIVCKIVLKSLTHRYKHTRKYHSKSKKNEKVVHSNDSH